MKQKIIKNALNKTLHLAILKKGTPNMKEKKVNRPKVPKSLLNRLKVRRLGKRYLLNLTPLLSQKISYLVTKNEKK